MVSYWSSKGYYDPKVPEALIHSLSDNLSLITEIFIAVFQVTEARFDLLRMLDIDLVFAILMCLNDPPVLVRASAVSKSWQMFVISYGVCKKLYMKKFPQLPNISYITEQSDDNSSRPNRETSDAAIKREHRVYTSLRYNVEAFNHTLKDTSGVDNTQFDINSLFSFLPPRDFIWGNMLQFANIIPIQQIDIPNFDLDLNEEMDMMDLILM